LKAVFGIKIRSATAISQTMRQIVAEVRQAIGADVALMVDFNQCSIPSRRAGALRVSAAFDLHWVEEPVRARGPRRHARASARRRRCDPDGREFGGSARHGKAIATGASDYAMLDVMKIGASPAGCARTRRASAFDPRLSHSSAQAPCPRFDRDARIGSDASRRLGRHGRAQCATGPWRQQGALTSVMGIE